MRREMRFSPHVAYSMAKYGMSLCTLAWREEFKKDASPRTRCGRAR